MRVDEAVLRLKNGDALARLLSAGALRDAMEAGGDVSSAEDALKGALTDNDKDVRSSAARVLTDFFGRRKAWKQINALLSDKRADVRASVLYKLEGLAGQFDIKTDLPNVIKSLDDQDYEVREEAVGFFAKAAEQGLDISAALPGLERAAIYGDERVKEKAGNALKAQEFRRDPGQRCAYCFDCETGLGLGDASKSLEYLAIMIKSLSCCGGDVTHRVLGCSKCGKRYLSTYFDHSDSGRGQFSISVISKEDAERIAAEFKKCPNPEWRLCKCDAHMGYLKDEQVPVKGKINYSAEDQE